MSPSAVHPANTAVEGDRPPVFKLSINMKSNHNALKSGIFILASVVASVGIIVAIKGSENWSDPKVLRAASFSLQEDIGGLQAGDDVQIGGYKVGTVEKITVLGATEADQNEPPRLRIEFTIPKKYVIRKNPVLKVQQGVTGGSRLNFESLGQGQAIALAEEIDGNAGGISAAMTAFARLSNPLNNILQNVDKKTIPLVNDTVAKFGGTADSFKITGDHATALVDNVKTHVDPALSKYHTFADRGSEMMVKIRDLIGDTTTDFRSTVKNLSSISGQIDQKLPKLLTGLETTVASVNAALDDVKKAADNTREVTASARGILSGNRGKIDAMVASLKTTGDNLKNATAEVRRSPWRLLYKPGPNEMANMNLYDAARGFAEGANDLNDASTSLRDALKSPDTDKATVEKLMLRVNKSFENFQQVEQKLWTSVKED